MQWLGRLVASLSPRGPAFDPRSIQVKYVLHKVALEQIFLREFLFSPVGSIPPGLHTHLHRQLLLPERQMGETWEPSKMQCSCEKRGTMDRKIPPLFSVFLCWNNKTVSLTSFGMAKGRIDASQRLVLSNWQLCGEKKCVQNFGVFTCRAETMWNTET